MREAFHYFHDFHSCHASWPIVFLGTSDLATVASGTIFIIDEKPMFIIS
jgi:hypothetical protein